MKPPFLSSILTLPRTQMDGYYDQDYELPPYGQPWAPQAATAGPASDPYSAIPSASSAYLTPAAYGGDSGDASYSALVQNKY